MVPALNIKTCYVCSGKRADDVNTKYILLTGIVALHRNDVIADVPQLRGDWPAGLASSRARSVSGIARRQNQRS